REKGSSEGWARSGRWRRAGGCLIAGPGGFAGLVSGRTGSSCAILVGCASARMCRLLIWSQHFRGFCGAVAWIGPGFVRFRGWVCRLWRNPALPCRSLPAVVTNDRRRAPCPRGKENEIPVARSVDEDELIEHWTLVGDGWTLLAGKRGPTRLGFALLLLF